MADLGGDTRHLEPEAALKSPPKHATKSVELTEFEATRVLECRYARPFPAAPGPTLNLDLDRQTTA